MDTSINLPASSFKIAEDNPGMWQGFYLEGRPFGRIACYFNDFNEWTADAWSATEVDVGAGNTSQILLDARNGVLQLLAAGNEDDGCQIQLGGSGDSETTGESWAPSAGKNLWFEAFVTLSDATQSDMFVGLHVEDTTIVAGRGSGYIGFSKDDGDALIDFTTAASSVAATDPGIHTAVAATYAKLGFKVTGVDKIEYYVNDVLKGTQQNNIPTELMKLSLAFLTGAAAANDLRIDYVVVAQER